MRVSRGLFLLVGRSVTLSVFACLASAQVLSDDPLLAKALSLVEGQLGVISPGPHKPLGGELLTVLVSYPQGVVVSALELLANSEREGIRVAVARVAGSLLSPSGNLWPSSRRDASRCKRVLAKLLEDPVRAVRLEAFWSCDQAIGLRITRDVPPAVLPVVQSILDGGNDRERLFACIAVARLGPMARSLHRVINELRKSKDGMLRACAVAALSKIGVLDEGVFIEALLDVHDHAVGAASDALRNLPGLSDVGWSALLKCFARGDIASHVKMSLASAMAKHGRSEWRAEIGLGAIMGSLEIYGRGDQAEKLHVVGRFLACLPSQKRPRQAFDLLVLGAKGKTTGEKAAAYTHLIGLLGVEKSIAEYPKAISAVMSYMRELGQYWESHHPDVMIDEINVWAPIVEGVLGLPVTTETGQLVDRAAHLLDIARLSDVREVRSWVSGIKG